MRNTLLTTLFAIASIVTATASPLWMRYSTISPQGDKIAFAYKGNIYVVSSQGGEAKQLTTTQSYETMPIWSPDGKKIAFASDRNGNLDIFIISATGGEVKRVTTHSSNETPLSFSADGKEIFFSAAIQKPATNVQYPSAWITELYTISVDGGREKQVVSNPVMNMALAPDGSSFLYENRTGSENSWRKHHVSSVARNIYYYDAKSKIHKQLTTNVGEDRNPILTPDGKVLFLSERDGGAFNVYEADRNDMENPKALTHFKNHPVRFLSQAKDGTICFGYHGEIYIQKRNEKARKVAVEILNDLPLEQLKELRVSGGAMDMTPDGSQIVFINRGEVFATTDKYETTKRITHTPEAEHSVTIAPDGRTMAYASERGGIWSIYTAKIARSQELNFANSTLIEENPLFENPKVERFAPSFSPDGKELAFIEERTKLMVINLTTKKVRQITDGKYHYGNSDTGFNYSWSPDGKWFVTSIVSNIRAPYTDIAIVSATDGGKLYNITNTGYMDQNPQWSLNGNAILFVSNRFGMRSHASWGSQNDLFLAFLNQDAYDKHRMTKEEYELMKEEEKAEKKAKGTDSKSDKEESKNEKEADKSIRSIDIDLENVGERVVLVTPMSSTLGGGILSKEGDKLYFLSSFENKMDLWEYDLKERSSKIVKKDAGRGKLSLSKDGKSLYILGSSSQKITLSSKTSTPIKASITMQYDAAKERDYMFNHVFTQQTKRFYKTDYHGVDLVQLKKDYKAFLPHIANNYDFAEMLSEILGELNVSHTGSGYRAPRSSEQEETAELGALYDLNFVGDGLKIDEVIKKGPLDRKISKIKAGHIIEKIDGNGITSKEGYYALLNRKAGRKILLSLLNPATNERWDEVIKPITKSAMAPLLYERWIKSRAAEVERLSRGRLGYVHIKSMDDESYRSIYADILGKYNQYDGIVIDTRFNGGGRLHEDIEILFSGEKYLEQTIRGVKYCDMPSRRYNKPSIMLTCEANYSNAHGTPWVYRYRKIGSIVGMPVPGTMTSVNWETLQDPTLYFGIPVIGYVTKEGEFLENSQLEPDFKVENNPEALDRGIDLQLEVAVKELLNQIRLKPTW
ncbi:MAG: S41 family peptidase [Phocaeicola sp.]